VTGLSRRCDDKSSLYKHERPKLFDNPNPAACDPYQITLSYISLADFRLESEIVRQLNYDGACRTPDIRTAWIAVHILRSRFPMEYSIAWEVPTYSTLSRSTSALITQRNNFIRSPKTFAILARFTKLRVCSLSRDFFSRTSCLSDLIC
jgi:hypothetical protein